MPLADSGHVDRDTPGPSTPGDRTVTARSAAGCSPPPAQPSRPTSRRRPLGGAGVRVGGRPDPRAARADPRPPGSRVVVGAGGVPGARRGSRGSVIAGARHPRHRAAYLVRWLELGDGVRRPAWSAFVADLT